ncbi:LysR family transcriptional regulator [Microlunatus parietis]|uniref:DNA-binding transcriptional LysR family regulator n=1 Tax=Microlunatus parietis TaxID=682979 RepID=A0A7Y9I448_9ACTN|nr:LysR family transcriptional regulator [Microlunatus parietis]NYE69681.1 DNA-binding transcriptional LysR family regulator [Microlunatus parietis]
MLDVAKLVTLRAVLAHGSFSSAAAALNLTQPAVSRQVSLLERQVGTQLVRRTQRGVYATEAGRLLTDHAEVIIGRLALAEAQLADLTGLRAGQVRLGSFFTALIYLSAEAAVALEARHPDLFRLQRDVIKDELVDRAAAFRRLAANELDLAIVFEHSFRPDPPPPDGIELIPLFDDPPCALLPSAHPLAEAGAVKPKDLRADTWIRAHHGSAAALVDHVLTRAGIRPEIVHAGHGDEPVEAQAFVAAGRGVSVAHRLNVILDPAKISSVPLQGGPVRHIQAAIMRGQRAPAVLALSEALQEVARLRDETHTRGRRPR